MPFSFVPRQTSAVPQTSPRRIDLNADVGEAGTFEQRAREEALLSLVSSVNVVCGGHAGDERSMRQIVLAASRHNLAVGAHPGYPDRETHGRRPLSLAPAEVTRLLVGQLSRLIAIADDCHVRLTHVKPHGALYNQAADDPRLAAAVAQAVATVNPALRLVGLAGSALLDAGRRAALTVVSEAFADRQYTAAGRLVPRGESGAVISDAESAVRQALTIVTRGVVRGADGTELPVEADTICVHGDTPGALDIARALRAALEAEGVEILAFK